VELQVEALPCGVNEAEARREKTWRLKNLCVEPF
jgi:hypothetical protein